MQIRLDVNSAPPDWMVEHDFWFKKAQRAWMRYEAARDIRDSAGVNRAMSQFDLCHRRMDAATPPEEKSRRTVEKERERCAAMEEDQ